MNRLYAFVFLLVFITSCEITPYEKPHYFLANYFEVDYFEHPVGSWWVYQDTVTLERDSIVLLSSDKILIEKDEIEFIEEVLLQRFQSSAKGGVMGKLSAKSMKYVQWRVDDETSLEELFNYETKHTYDYIHLPSDSTKKHKVVNFAMVSDSTVQHRTSFAKRIGLVEKDIDGSVWRLVKFHINDKQ